MDTTTASLFLNLFLLFCAIWLTACRSDDKRASEKRIAELIKERDEFRDERYEFAGLYRKSQTTAAILEKRLLAIADVLNPEIEFCIEDEMEEPK